MNLYIILTLIITLNNSKYVNPFRKVAKGIDLEMNEKVKSFIRSVSDSVSFINMLLWFYKLFTVLTLINERLIV